jgi:hypothetical protein
MKKYTVTENPAPFTEGESTIASMNIPYRRPQDIRPISNRLVSIPSYTSIEAIDVNFKPPIQVNSTIINQEINILNQGNSTRITALYNHSNSINNITTKTALINDGLGIGSYDDNNNVVWTSNTNRITSNNLKEIIVVTINLKCSTDTLGGAFELEVNNGNVLDIIENNINIQNQDFNIETTIVVDQTTINNGVQFFLKPEIGMSLTISNFSLLIIKG